MQLVRVLLGALVEAHQLRRVAEGQWAEQDCFDDGEDRGDSADADGQGEDRRSGESGGFAELAEREVQVAKKVGMESPVGLFAKCTLLDQMLGALSGLDARVSSREGDPVARPLFGIDQLASTNEQVSHERLHKDRCGAVMILE